MHIGCTVLLRAAIMPALLHGQVRKSAEADWPVYTHDLAGSPRRAVAEGGEVAPTRKATPILALPPRYVEEHVLATHTG